MKTMKKNAATLIVAISEVTISKCHVSNHKHQVQALQIHIFSACASTHTPPNNNKTLRQEQQNYPPEEEKDTYCTTQRAIGEKYQYLETEKYL